MIFKVNEMDRNNLDLINGKTLKGNFEFLGSSGGTLNFSLSLETNLPERILDILIYTEVFP